MEDYEQVQIDREKLNKHPKQNVSFLNHFFYCWQISVLRKISKKKVINNLYEPLKEFESKALGDRLEQLWQEEVSYYKKPSLFRALFKQFGTEFILEGMLFLPFELIYIFGKSIFLVKLLDYFSDGGDFYNACIHASLMILVTIIRAINFHHHNSVLSIMSLKIRIACSCLIYRKALKLKQTSLENMNVGQIINLLSNDVNKFENVFAYAHSLWIAPLCILLGMITTDLYFGHGALLGFTCLIAFVIIQICIIQKLTSVRKATALKSDYRVKLMNDIICGIQAIKMYTWEKPFITLVKLARSQEIDKISVGNMMRQTSITFRVHYTKIVILLSIIWLIFEEKKLTSQYIFGLTAIYNIYKVNTIVIFQNGCFKFAETVATIRRIEKYLLHDYVPELRKISNLDVLCIPKSLRLLTKKTSGIMMKDVTVKWKDSSLVLDHINFEAHPSELVGIFGTAGSGKTTLLLTILQEINLNGGSLDIGGTISYACQEPWIFPSSVKQNIIFGEKFIMEKYLEVIRVCALQRDIEMFPSGDQTLVGERGVMLSGGQKARISLARAVYREADIYLLDDPLSAVDTHVAHHIFYECICRYLKNKCVILVTHQTQFFKNVEKVYSLENGKIERKTCETPTNLTANTKNNLKEDIEKLQQYQLQYEAEEHQNSNINSYLYYLKSIQRPTLVTITGFLLILGQALICFLDYFLTIWINVDNKNQSTFHNLTTYSCLYIYLSMLILLILIEHLLSLSFVLCFKQSSINLHNNMLKKIIYGTMDFFNHHTSGRILNRFTKDMGYIDESLATNFPNIIVNTFIIFGANITIIISNYWMLLPALILWIIIFYFGFTFHHANRHIKRSEAITRSILFTHLSASVQGLQTIRAFDVQKKIIEEFDNYQDLNSSAYYMHTMIFACFGFWTDIMCVFYSAILTASFFLLSYSSMAGFVGLGITQAFSFLGSVQYLVKTWSELDAQMISVERVADYTELQPELDEGVTKPLENWPTKGDVAYDHVQLKYSPDAPPVLKNVSFCVNRGEKIGIVGRTGAGKSSLISVLFRLYPFDGSVFIDNLNTKNLTLDSLRSKISVIPQDPILFLGTLRRNIDPFNNYSDEEIWKCFEEINMKETISKLPSGLNSIVSEKGSNFSVGEKQLLCLVRAMLRNNKIIVMDEATANVDSKTDNLIQSTIRKKFKNCTVFTIAHRLNTVMDSDKILVMENGEVVEFGNLKDLLDNKQGYFYNYVQKMELLVE